MNRPELGPNHNCLRPMLEESVHRFLTEYRKGSTDFSNFASIFSRFLQNLPDPPLEIVWFYSALTFHSTKSPANYAPKQLSLCKDLFQLLVSCSSSCNAQKKIAALAPVVAELHSLVLDKNGFGKEAESLLEGIASYISICCSSNYCQGDDVFGDLGPCFVDLVRVWVVGRVREDCKIEEGLKGFCPIVSDGVRKEMMRDRYGVSYLAGVVMVEAFLLKLCLRFGYGASRAELEKELHSLAVQAMTAFRSYYFVDTLLRMLLESVLPVTSLLNTEEEVLLREVLFDAVMMTEYSFLSTVNSFQLPGVKLKNLAMKWLFVADNAIRFARENGDQMKFFSYAQAFSESCLPSQVIEWVRNQPGLQNEISTPSVSTPVALITPPALKRFSLSLLSGHGWLLIVDDHGIGVFDSDKTKIYAKTIICKSRLEYDLLELMSDNKNLARNHCRCATKEGQVEDKVDGDLKMVDCAGNMVFTPPGPMEPSATNGTRKRKEGENDEGDKKVKYSRCDLHDNPLAEKIFLSVNDDGLSSGSEVDSPASGEDIEYMEQ